MHVLWRRGPATARDVHGDVSADTGWAYTTVKTMLDRLVEKGAIASSRAPEMPRVLVYRPLLERSQARLDALRPLAERAFGGAVAPLVHFLVEHETLSDEDRAELLQKLEREEGSSTRKTRSRSRSGRRSR